MRLDPCARVFAPRPHARLEVVPDVIFDQVCCLASIDDHGIALLSLAAASCTLRRRVGDFSRRHITACTTDLHNYRLRDVYPLPKHCSSHIALVRHRRAAAGLAHRQAVLGSLLDWKLPAMPSIRLVSETGMLVVSAGHELYVQGRAAAGHAWYKRVVGKHGVGDITDLYAAAHELVYATVSGQVVKVNDWQADFFGAKCTTMYAGDIPIEAIDVRCECSAIADKSGAVFMMRSGAVTERVATEARPWKLRFLGGDTRHLALGSRSRRPLTVLSATATGYVISRRYGTANSSKSSTRVDAPRAKLSSVFALHPFSSHDNLIMSGWYDGLVRLHDLRLASETPVLQMRAAYESTAVYSLARRGHAVWAGTAVNGVVRLFDIRSPAGPTSGNIDADTSVFIAGKRVKGPVYDLAIDHTTTYAAVDAGLRTLTGSPTKLGPSGAYFFNHGG
ncbi:hypothetical protein PYCC9005_001370 [Savitreella phatthalungensis]